MIQYDEHIFQTANGLKPPPSFVSTGVCQAHLPIFGSVRWLQKHMFFVGVFF